MKLSEAIREGCKGTEQGSMCFYDSESGRACAMGAAIVSAFGKTWAATLDGPKLEELHTAFPMLSVKMSAFPCGCVKHVSYHGLIGHSGYMRDGVGHMIAHLNDTHHWSREAIAEWVETIENAQERASKPATERNEAGTAPESSDVATTRQIESVLL